MTTPVWASLQTCEQVIAPSDERLWRQIHPNWLDGDLVSTEAFAGTSASRDRVSTARETVVSAKQAHDEYVRSGFASSGTWAVLANEVHRANCRSVDDADCPN